LFFISSAQAQSAAPAGDPGMMGSLIMFGGLFIFMYLFIIRPQRKRQKEHSNLLGGLSKGDEVTMTSGILGKITKLEGDYVILEVNNNLELKFQLSAVHAVLPKGTIKAI
jgi:preprotein translocase subunit YajC